ncbi:MAG: TonB-dependent receptor [Pseudomonadota bacterium]
MKNPGKKLNLINLMTLSTAVALGMSGSVDAHTVEAFSDDKIVLEQIVVTARKIHEKHQEVPMAFQVLTRERLDIQGFDNVSDANLLIPGLTYDIGAFVQDTRPAMRGMQNERGRPSVAVLIDHVDASSENLSIPGGSSMLSTRLLDVERIEVVKGPQTLLYGRNAFGGAINIITKRPEFEWGTFAGLDVGNGNRQTGEFGVTGPLIDNVLAFRAAVSDHSLDGFYNNPNTGEELGAQDNLSGSLGVLWKPREQLQAYARFQFSDENYSQPASALVTYDDRLPVPGGTFAAGPPGSPRLPCPGDLSTVPPQVQFACTRGVVIGELSARESDIDYSLDPTTGQPFDGMAQIQRFGTLQVDYQTDFGTLTYLGGFLQNDSTDRADADYTDFAVDDPFAFSISTINILDYQFEHQSHELRFAGQTDRMSWIVGGMTYLEDATLFNGAQFWLRNPNSLLGGPPFGLATEPNPGVKPRNEQNRDTEHYSAFFSLAYDINDRWTVTGAGRYSVDNIDYRVPTWSRQQVSLLQQVPVPICPVENDTRDVPQSQRYPNVAFDCSVSDSVESNVFTPRVAVEYRPGGNSLYYASVTTGFKPGGFAANEAVSLEGQRYNEERVTTYEIGGKTDWLEQQVRLNWALYYNDYRDQQIGIQQQPAGSITPIPGITNAGRVEVYGLELDATWQATDNLRVATGYAYTNATFDEFIVGEERSTALNRTESGNIEADFSGNRVGKNPNHALNVMADYRNEIPGTSFDWFAAATAIYRSKRFMDEANLAFLPEYTRLNLALGLSNDRYQVTAYVDNALDDDTVINGQRVVDLGNPDGFAPGRGYLLHLPEPRSFGVRVRFQF